MHKHPRTTINNPNTHNHRPPTQKQIRALIATSVYQKALRLSPAARQASTVGEIVNMMQLDAARYVVVLFVGVGGCFCDIKRDRHSCMYTFKPPTHTPLRPTRPHTHDTRLEGVASSVHTLWTGLLDITVYMAMLIACMGPSMLAGIVIMVRCCDRAIRVCVDA